MVAVRHPSIPNYLRSTLPRGLASLYGLIVNDGMFDDYLQVEEEPWKEQVDEQ